MLRLNMTKQFHLHFTWTTSGQQSPMKPRVSEQGFDDCVWSSAYQTEHWVAGLQAYWCPHPPFATKATEFGLGWRAKMTVGRISKIHHILNSYFSNQAITLLQKSNLNMDQTASTMIRRVRKRKKNLPENYRKGKIISAHYYTFGEYCIE